MATIHRTLDGSWANCDNASCQLKFHFPDLTVAEAEAIPLVVLLPLFEAVDPPTRIDSGGNKYWSIRSENPRVTRPHREYDLPAIISANGSLEWVQHGQLHRAHGRPARILSDGRRQWWINGRGAEVPSKP